MSKCPKCSPTSLDAFDCRCGATPNRHDEGRLPKWARERLDDLRREVARQASEIATLKAAHEVLHCRDWFVLKGHVAPDDRPFRLWTLDNDGAHPVCTIGPDDALLVVRARKEIP